MTSFKKMRLIPDFMYEKLHQSSMPRSPDFGDETNSRLLDMTKDISPLLKDTAKPIEERVRLFYQHLIRKLSAEEREKNLAPKDDDKKNEDKQLAAEKDRNERSKEMAIAQRQHHIIGAKSQTDAKPKKGRIEKKVNGSEQPGELIGYQPFGGLFPSPVKKKKDMDTKNANHKSNERRATDSQQSVTPSNPDITHNQNVSTPVTVQASSSQEPKVPGVIPLPQATGNVQEKEKIAQQAVEQEEEEHFSTANEGEDEESGASPHDESDRDTWREKQLNDLKAGNRLSAQRRLKELLGNFFIIDHKSGELTFRDDSKTLRGADVRKIANYFVPLKNIHPKAKPNGVAAVVEILRVKELIDPLLFPNQSVADLFNEYGAKPTAYQNKIRDIHSLNEQIKSLAAGLHVINGSSDKTAETSAGKAQTKDWPSFD